MEWKYKMVFLLLSLCLVRAERVYSQNCVTMRYDEDGNRISMLVHQCGSEYKSQDQRNIADEEISINGNQELYVYPNPNEGVFDISVDEEEESIVVQIYNVNGVMVKNEYLSEDKKMDITDNPAGIYLLRIIKGDDVCSRIVVKL